MVDLAIPTHYWLVRIISATYLFDRVDAPDEKTRPSPTRLLLVFRNLLLLHTYQ